MRENYFDRLTDRHYRILDFLSEGGKNSHKAIADCLNASRLRFFDATLFEKYRIKPVAAKAYVNELRSIAEEEGYGKTSLDTILRWYRERREWLRSAKTYGAIEGTLENDRPDKSPEHYRIRDILDGRSTPCYFDTREAIDVARGAIDKRVYTFGVLIKDPEGYNEMIVASEIKVFPPNDELPLINEMIGILRGDRPNPSNQVTEKIQWTNKL